MSSFRIGFGFIQIEQKWPEFEGTLRSKSLVLQYVEIPTAGVYQLFAADSAIVYTCLIYLGAVPPTSGVTQEENDAWKATFLADWEPSANRSLQPRTGDGKPEQTPNLFPNGTVLYLAGRADDASLGRGKGALFEITSDVVGDMSLEFGFVDVIWLAGGGAEVAGGQFGDALSFEAHAPATPVVPNGGGTGNCNVVSGMLIPAAGNGAFDVDLTKGVPIPARDENNNPIGYWEWSFPLTGSGTITPGTPGKAGYYLVAAPVHMATFACHIPMSSNGYKPLILPAIAPKPLFPQHRLKVILHNSGHAGLKLAWHLVTAREKTA